MWSKQVGYEICDPTTFKLLYSLFRTSHDTPLLVCTAGTMRIGKWFPMIGLLVWEADSPKYRLTLGRTRKVIRPPWYKGEGGGGMEPPLSFWKLLMTSYLVTIVTDHHKTCLKMRARDKRTATENFRCWCFIVEEKNQKNLSGGGNLPPLPSTCTSEG